MKPNEQIRLREVETKIRGVKDTLAEILKLYNQVHRRKLMLEFDLKRLEDEKMDILQGQLPLGVDRDEPLPF